MRGTVDVYWLHDDGGLTLLLPHILTTRKKFSKSRLRIFALHDPDKNVAREIADLQEMLSNFRLDVESVAILDDLDKRPSKKTKKEFDDLIKPVLKSEQPVHGSVASTNELEPDK